MAKSLARTIAAIGGAVIGLAALAAGADAYGRMAESACDKRDLREYQVHIGDNPQVESELKNKLDTNRGIACYEVPLTGLGAAAGLALLCYGSKK